MYVCRYVRIASKTAYRQGRLSRLHSFNDSSFSCVSVCSSVSACGQKSLQKARPPHPSMHHTHQSAVQPVNRKRKQKAGRERLSVCLCRTSQPEGKKGGHADHKRTEQLRSQHTHQYFSRPTCEMCVGMMVCVLSARHLALPCWATASIFFLSSASSMR